MNLTSAILIATMFTTCVVLGDKKPAFAQELPLFDSAAYCTNLTSKMLVKSERVRETASCMFIEGIAKARLQQHWSLVTPVVLKSCVKYGLNVYIELQGCIALWIGMECMRGHIKCG